MGFWRNIATLAARRVDDAACETCPPGLPGEDPAFTTAVTALGAKLAKADGRADGGEFGAFAEVFQPESGSARDIQRLYDLARQTTLGYEAYARRLAKRYGGCPQLLEDVLDGLFHIAKADGAVLVPASRRARSHGHPDRVLARGLPPEFVEVAHAGAAAINAAFDGVMRERGAGALQPVA